MISRFGIQTTFIVYSTGVTNFTYTVQWKLVLGKLFLQPIKTWVYNDLCKAKKKKLHVTRFRLWVVE
jgi:hypothetical protein